MKLPRDIDAPLLIKKLELLGYGVTRQSGSHIRLTTAEKGVHHVTIPFHRPIRVGTLNAILNDIAGHFETTKEKIISMLFL